MAPSETEMLRKELQEIRREMRGMRRWAIFSAGSIGLLLFFPKLAAVIADSTERFLNALLGDQRGIAGMFGMVVAIVVVVLIAAAILSRRVAPVGDSDASKGGRS